MIRQLIILTLCLISFNVMGQSVIDVHNERYGVAGRYEPTKDDSILVMSCRKSVIDRIQLTDIPQKDSISNLVSSIKIYYIDSLYMFLYGLSDYKGAYLPNKDIIIISNKVTPDKRETITHELNHYVDKLRGSKKDTTIFWSNLNNLSCYNEIHDTTVMLNIIKLVYKDTNIDLYQCLTACKMFSYYKKTKGYYLSAPEIYVRSLEMKSKMIEAGVIESYTCKLEKDDIRVFLTTVEINDEDPPNYFAMTIMMSDDDLLTILNRVY